MELVETEMNRPIDDLEPLAIRESLPLPLEDGQQLYDRLATELLDTARLQQISTLLIGRATSTRCTIGFSMQPPT